MAGATLGEEDQSGLASDGELFNVKTWTLERNVL